MTTFYNRAWMTTATAGTGTITLGAARAGYFSFADAGVPNSAQVRYELLDGDNVEIGLGTYTTAGTTMSRDTVLTSLIAGVKGTTKLTLSGAATVLLTLVAEDLGSNAFNSTAIPAAAAQADQETSTSTTTYVAPGTQQFHPSAAKCWARAAGVGTLTESFNITSVTDTGTGDLDITIATDFSTATWCALASVVAASFDTTTAFVNPVWIINAQAAGTVGLQSANTTTSTTASQIAFALADPTSYSFVGYGDQA